MKLKKISKRAFSLIELSIVILIVSILITGALSVSISNINNSKVKVTNDRIKEVYKALGNFLIINGRLPCPASLQKIKSVDSDYGAEVGAPGACEGAGIYTSNTTSTLIYGMVPIRALGMANDMGEDAFESKLNYIVDKNFTSTSTFGTAAFTYGSYNAANETITIQDKPGGVTQNISFDAIFALISSGSNKSGAFPANSATQNDLSADADEQDNYATNFNDSPTPKTADFNNNLIISSSNSDVFDDITFFKARNNFISDFSMLSLIPCAAYTDGSSYSWPAGSYEQAVTSTTACPNAATNGGPAYPVKRCGAFGVWGAVINACL